MSTFDLAILIIASGISIFLIVGSGLMAIVVYVLITQRTTVVYRSVNVSKQGEATAKAQDKPAVGQRQVTKQATQKTSKPPEIQPKSLASSEEKQHMSSESPRLSVKSPKIRSKKSKSRKKPVGQPSPVPVLSPASYRPKERIAPKRKKNPDKKSAPTTIISEVTPAKKAQQKTQDPSQWQDFEFTEDSKRAYEMMVASTNNCVFVTGKAGTGKSHLLKYFKAHTNKNVVFLAPTGVAALNICGQTIHSFFKFPPRILNRDDIKRVHNPEIYKNIDTIVIDEISMVRVDMMDNIDQFLRINGKVPGTPFGGVQMVFFGDLYQLPPVVGSDEEESKFLSTYYPSPYFFDAKVFDEVTVEMVELNKVYRQSDPQFLELLNAIRLGRVTDSQVLLINQRYSPDFVPPATEEYLTLTPDNRLAAEINNRELARLPNSPQKYTGIVVGDFRKLKRNLPTEVELVLKKDAQVMFVKNDMCGRWVNGKVGKIDRLDENGIYVELKAESDGHKYIHAVERETWELLKYRFDHATGRIQADVVASFSQYPLKLAWAITIHKSQGLTLDNTIIDMGNGAFAHGQTYVAMSRCKTYEGIRLKRKLDYSDFKVDSAIHRVRHRFKCTESESSETLGISFGKNYGSVPPGDNNDSHINELPPLQKQRKSRQTRTVIEVGNETNGYDEIGAKLEHIANLVDKGMKNEAKKEMTRLFPKGWCRDPRYLQLKRRLYGDRNIGAAQP